MPAGLQADQSEDFISEHQVHSFCSKPQVLSAFKDLPDCRDVSDGDEPLYYRRRECWCVPSRAEGVAKRSTFVKISLGTHIQPGQSALKLAPHRPDNQLMRVSLGWCVLVTIGAAVSVMVLAGCHTNGRDGSATSATAPSGLASYYADALHGRPTASGERYRKHELTAAHRTLPFGSLVRVTNRLNGRSVTVRINDRGPFVRGRVIDLSRGAATRLEMVQAGVVQVELKVLKVGA